MMECATSGLWSNAGTYRYTSSRTSRNSATGNGLLLGTSVGNSLMPLVLLSRNHQRSVAYNGHTFRRKYLDQFTYGDIQTSAPKPHRDKHGGRALCEGRALFRLPMKPPR